MQENENESLIDVLLHGLGCYIRTRSVMILIGIGILIVVFLMLFNLPVKYTHITDIADYGNYSGTGANSFTEQYIDSFFPQRISESFTKIQYSYKAEDLDAYGFEAYLEFTIEDTDEFNEYVALLSEEYEWQEFAFDSNFKECKIENILVLDIDDSDDPESIYYHQIVQAKIRKILYCQKTRTIIYVAIGVYDGGGIGTNFLNVFFDRFHIDPIQYAQTADAGNGVDPYGYAVHS